METTAAEDLTSLAGNSAWSAAIADLRRSVDARLEEVLGRNRHQDGRVSLAMRYGALAPGKRLRPLMMLLTARALGAEEGSLMDVACALELVHAASLFLDDLPCMDDAALRRGQPTVHVKFGEDVATLSAVALLAEAWRLTANSQRLDATARLSMVTVFSDAVGVDGLVVGQYRDLHESSSASVAAAKTINHQKTSVLFEAAFDIACLAAGSSGETRECLKAAAAELGQAFQLLDDLADFELTSAETGKDAKQDVGKTTLVALLGPKLARQRLDSHVALAREYLEQAMPSDNSVIALTDSLFSRGRLK